MGNPLDELLRSLPRVQHDGVSLPVRDTIDFRGGVTVEDTGTAVRVTNTGGVTFASVQTALGVASSAVSVNGQRLTGLGEPTGAQDAATRAYVLANAGVDVRTMADVTIPVQGQTFNVTLSRVPPWIVADENYPVCVANGAANLFSVSAINGTTVTLVNSYSVTPGTTVAAGARVSVGWDGYASAGTVDAYIVSASSSVRCGGSSFGWGVIDAGSGSLEFRTGAGGDVFCGNTLGAVSSKKDAVGGLEFGQNGSRLLWGSGAPSGTPVAGSMRIRTDPVYPEHAIAFSDGWAMGVRSGGTLADADATLSVSNGNYWRMPRSTLTTTRTITLGTSGAAADNDTIVVDKYDSSSNTVTVVNGGGGGGTILTTSLSAVRLVFKYGGTNWTLQNAMRLAVQ